jgi:hypothetical protein
MAERDKGMAELLDTGSWRVVSRRSWWEPGAPGRPDKAVL